MKKMIAIILCFVLLFTNVKAQDQNCDAAALTNIKGEWKKASDANMKADKNQLQINSRIDIKSN